MIAYREQRSRADPRRVLSSLRSTVDQAPSTGPPHDLARETLIQIGVLESAVADTVFPLIDGIHSLSETLRQTSLTAAHALWHTWHNNREGAALWWRQLSRDLGRVALYQLPREVELTQPEGYSHYGVYPEMYLGAATQCVKALGSFPATCLGLRSIGSSLSAVVAAALTELGCEVESFTIRPRGHPFSRSPRFTSDLALRLSARQHTRFLLVDEGPGMSGSSLAGTAAALRSWGIADDQILVFPSWRTDGSELRSAAARDSWSRHRQFLATFEAVWLDSGRLQAEFPGELRDVSAGRWRPEVYSSPESFPAVQPQHERRKYLISTSGSLRQAPGLLSFIGLTSGVQRKIYRAQRLADAGFTPRPEKAAHGFMLRRFVPGVPVRSGTADEALLNSVASYLAHLCREHRAEPSVSDSSLREMITVNLSEGLPQARVDEILAHFPADGWAERPVALDGRMLAHEWIQSPTGHVKVDAVDHHDDHFFPGCQDIAWDLSGAASELGLGREKRRYLVNRYRAISGDRTIARRLPQYRIAYLAFRLGYTSLAASVLGDTADGIRFAGEVDRYIGLLRRELAEPLRGLGIA